MATVRPALRRLGILGDIHAEHEFLQSALAFLANEGLDAILSVGDIADGPGDLDACCRELVAHGVVTVRGNHDRWFLSGEMRGLPEATPAGGASEETLRFLRALPSTRRLPTVEGELLLCHGTDDDDMLAVRPDDFGYALEANEPLQRWIRSGERRLVVCGHSHRRMVRSFGSLTLVNAGALRRHDEPGFAVADLAAGTVTFHELLAGGRIVTSDVAPLR